MSPYVTVFTLAFRYPLISDRALESSIDLAQANTGNGHIVHSWLRGRCKWETLTRAAPIDILKSNYIADDEIVNRIERVPAGRPKIGLSRVISPNTHPKNAKSCLIHQ